MAESDKAWVGDITYIATDEGWFYLIVVIDLFSRQVVGWSLRHDMTSNIFIDALRMAWFKRQPDKQAGLRCHSDQGSQYTSGAFRDVLKGYGITSSMSRRGNCWDTQFKIFLSAAFGLTRAGIGVMPRIKPSRGCSGTTRPGRIQSWLLSARCNSKANGLSGKPTHELGYEIGNPEARSLRPLAPYTDPLIQQPHPPLVGIKVATTKKCARRRFFVGYLAERVSPKRPNR